MHNSGLKHVRYEDWDFFLDEAACDAYYRALPVTAPRLSGYLPPMTRCLSVLGADIRRPMALGSGGTDGLCYLLFGTATSETGYELDFYGSEAFASVVVRPYPEGVREEGCSFSAPCVLLQVFGNYAPWLDRAQ